MSYSSLEPVNARDAAIPLHDASKHGMPWCTYTHTHNPALLMHFWRKYFWRACFEKSCSEKKNIPVNSTSLSWRPH